ncbi:MAG: methionine synthase [Cyanobacterium sp. T60_A2020_053]|nr:methionine synthase [Cyanobacterium sp. T60_A2020_053]
MQGIYIVANNKVKENAIALLNSIRLYDKETPIYLIPFDDKYQEVFKILEAKHSVKLFPDLDFVNKFTAKIATIFDRDFLALPNKMRKLVQWFGPLDEFLYIDTDIVVFEKIIDNLQYLQEYDFLNCDYHFKGRKLNDIFSPVVLEKNIFSSQQLEDVFNSGFWASKKGIFTENELYQILAECALHREYFDFSQKTTDQPILNYLILKTTQKRLNLVKLTDNEPGNWAGSPHFEEKDHILYDQGKRLKYVHWAGVAVEGAYADLWQYYRYLGEGKLIKISPNNPYQNYWNKLKLKLKQFLP